MWININCRMVCLFNFFFTWLFGRPITLATDSLKYTFTLYFLAPLLSSGAARICVISMGMLRLLGYWPCVYCFHRLLSLTPLFPCSPPFLHLSLLPSLPPTPLSLALAETIWSTLYGGNMPAYSKPPWTWIMTPRSRVYVTRISGKTLAALQVKRPLSVEPVFVHLRSNRNQVIGWSVPNSSNPL